MSDELKKCPLCGKEFVFQNSDRLSKDEFYLHPQVNGCMLSGMVFAEDFINARPIEDALQARINELEHKNEVLMDSYLESETIDDKGKLVGSLEYFKKRITDLEAENDLLSGKATVDLLKPFVEQIKLENEPMPVIHAGIKMLLDRIDKLEKQLQSYKDFCSAIEREE